MAIELDGEVHRNEDAEIKDGIRTRFLKELGIKVIRFENRFVFEDPEFKSNVIRSFFGWREREATTPSSEADATPPKQGGEFKRI